jgi:hypothetical protein
MFVAGLAMVFVWTGRGYWGVLLPVLFVWVLGMVANLSVPLLIDNNAWVYGVAVIVAAGANFAIARRWNGTEWLKPWDVRGMLLRRRRAEHTIFAMPLELWSIPLIAIGVWVIVTNLPGATR